MNLLNFIDKSDFNAMQNNPFDYINLHTKNLNEAEAQCNKFFASHHNFYYTNSTDYQHYAGWRYELCKDVNGNCWLVLQNNKQIEF